MSERPCDPAGAMPGRPEPLLGPLRRALLRGVATVAVGPLVAGAAVRHTLANPVHRAAERVRGADPVPPAPPGPPVSGMAEAVARVEAIPGPHPASAWSLLRGGGPDVALALLTADPQRALLGWRYPPAFRHRSLRASNGQSTAALVALQPEPARPAVIVVHGVLDSKHFDYVRRACLRAYEAGFHVLAADMRGFGVTALVNDAPPSLGWAEGEDLLAAAEHLRACGATSVGAVGFSLGASALLNAARRSRPGVGLDGGVLAVSAPTDLYDALVRLSTRPPLREAESYLNWLTIRMAVTARFGDGSGPLSPLEAMERYSVPYYGLPLRELARRGSAVDWTDEIGVPTLLVHAVDDPVVPVEQARGLAQRAAGNELVHVHVSPVGRHAAFDVIDPSWAGAVQLSWLRAWAQPAPSAAAD